MLTERELERLATLISKKLLSEGTNKLFVINNYNYDRPLLPLFSKKTQPTWVDRIINE